MADDLFMARIHNFYTISASTEYSVYTATNMGYLSQPERYWRSETSNAATVTVDIGSNEQMSALALIDCNASRVRVTASTDAAFGVTQYDSGTVYPYWDARSYWGWGPSNWSYHKAWRLFLPLWNATTSLRYVKIELLGSPFDGSTYHRIGSVALAGYAMTIRHTTATLPSGFIINTMKTNGYSWSCGPVVKPIEKLSGAESVMVRSKRNQFTAEIEPARLEYENPPNIYGVAYTGTDDPILLYDAPHAWTTAAHETPVYLGRFADPGFRVSVDPDNIMQTERITFKEFV